jgi:hypothetical protein
MKWLFVGAWLWLDRLQVRFGECEWLKLMRTIQLVERALPLFCGNDLDNDEGGGVTVRKVRF